MSQDEIPENALRLIVTTCWADGSLREKLESLCYYVKESSFSTPMTPAWFVVWADEDNIQAISRLRDVEGVCLDEEVAR